MLNIWQLRPVYEGVKDNIGNEEYTNGIRYADNRGIYVMICRYSDKDGAAAYFPDGIEPDREVYDNSLD